jgi:hypothetical protein
MFLSGTAVNGKQQMRCLIQRLRMAGLRAAFQQYASAYFLSGDAGFRCGTAFPPKLTVIAAKAGTQYSSAPMFIHARPGILGRPVERAMTVFGVAMLPLRLSQRHAYRCTSSVAVPIF